MTVPSDLFAVEGRAEQNPRPGDFFTDLFGRSLIIARDKHRQLPARSGPRRADRDLGGLDSDVGLAEAAGRRRAAGRLSVARKEQRR